ncbi:hypothetical protein BSKO_06403 [Bryopsis sp. KO-2023]|nr:hypothetical protein BSKO_06403 [Bryopsis sp. KO-2023]
MPHVGKKEKGKCVDIYKAIACLCPVRGEGRAGLAPCDRRTHIHSLERGKIAKLDILLRLGGGGGGSCKFGVNPYEAVTVFFSEKIVADCYPLGKLFFLFLDQ